MQIKWERGDERNYIHSYAPGTVRINEASYAASVIVMPDRLIADWRPQTYEALAAEDFAQIAALHPELVLLGTGARLRFPHPTLARALVEAGIGMEVMDTGAACRTYTVLMAEGRKVAAALLL